MDHQQISDTLGAHQVIYEVEDIDRESRYQYVQAESGTHYLTYKDAKGYFLHCFLINDRAMRAFVQMISQPNAPTFASLYDTWGQP